MDFKGPNHSLTRTKLRLMGRVWETDNNLLLFIQPLLLLLTDYDETNDHPEITGESLQKEHGEEVVKKPQVKNIM